LTARVLLFVCLFVYHNGQVVLVGDKEDLEYMTRKLTLKSLN